MDKQHFQFIIVGAGFAGIAAAIGLKQKGFHDFVILERASDIGGVWRDNTYPGAICDVPSELYSYSFFPAPDFNSNFPTQTEILSYIKRCFTHYDLKDSLRLQSEVTKMQWNASNKHWEVEVNKKTLTCQYLIHALGALSEPTWPQNLPGFSEFQGPRLHTAHWNSHLDLKNKNIAVIGTGASAIQIIPELQKVAKKLFVIQRNPAWILPRPYQEHSPARQSLLKKFPFLLKVSRFFTYLNLEKNILFFRNRTLNAWAEQNAKSFLDSEIKNPVLQKQLTPKYAFGCKRVLLSNDYYQSLQAENVTVLDSRKVRFTDSNIMSDDGLAHSCDIIICATGFETKNKASYAMIYNDKDLSLGKRWQSEGQHTYLGTMVHGYPNLFLLAGPRTGLGHSSMIYIIESQVEFLVKLVEQAHQHDVVAFEPKAEAEISERAMLNHTLSQSVWGWENCQSWYQDSTGVAASLWPHFSFLFRRNLRKNHWQDFQLYLKNQK